MFGGALVRGARSTDGKRERFEEAMEVALTLALSSVAVSDSESKSAIGLRSVKCERAREGLGMAI